MAIYHFSNQIISRRKQQNAIASAAYRSGEKLLDERTNEIKFYKRKVKPVTHILAPSHAPEWVYNRQQLWNEVEKKEKQWNAQLAREINVALPNELTHDQQEQLAIEFCQDIFVDEGMVCDLALHRDDENNPHFHVLLTIRPFKEDGTWGNKQVKVKEFVNGKEQIKAVHTPDWNTKKKLFYWREQWAVYANRFLEMNGFSERITHLSHKDRDLLTLPTIHEGFVARDMKRKGKRSDRIQINTERKDYNNVLVELEIVKKEKRIKEQKDQFIRRFTPKEKKQLKDAAKVLRIFLNQESVQTRKAQLDKWSTRLEFSSESVDTLKKLNRIQREREIVDKVETILETEANRFLNHYYSNVDTNSFSKEQKMEIVEATIARNKLLSDDDIQFVCTELEKNQIERELHLLLNHRPQFVLGIKSEILQATQKFDEIRRRHQIDFSDPSTIQKFPQNILNHMQFLLQRKKEMEASLELMNQLYRHQLDEMYPHWAGRHYLTLEEKEYFVMAKEYYGNTITPDDISNP
ncbi:MobQ family relaxase [Heyndrickxia acidicola]|uniref:MobQ family relaxase n=1 Tax=Heyndrickxia acidicola TaxID=209389 RepID=A0ABU6MFL5_9BACI|nr:MobQ family relaxase [Heyndrickxia acidicola]MED1203487.1 MobQ family relaxase [Heyndrickxia acidicola]